MLRGKYNDLRCQSRNSMIGINLYLIYTCHFATCFDLYWVILRQNKLHLQATTLANAYSLLTYAS
jgi:hypothetical protein